MRCCCSIVFVYGLGLAAVPDAHAIAPPEADPPAAADSETEAETETRGETSKPEPWLRRWAPEPHMLELGIYGGLFIFNAEHELYDPTPGLPEGGWQALRRLNPDVGLRVGYFPLRFFGLEAEAGLIPSAVAEGSALPFTVRGHALAQLGLWSVTPFVLVGAGMLGVGQNSPLGGDIDPALHFGGGAKIYLNRWLMLRVDLRDVVSHQRGIDNTFIAHNFEALLGLSVTLNRNKQPQTQAEPDPVHEPLPGDRDGDGIGDSDDACIDDPETVNGYLDEDGCPESDPDADGFWDDQDSCPDEPGIDPDGCPLRDSDGDGILDDEDQCIDEPESVNGFEDEDGCPDELPTALAEFTGNIKGITFETNKATIQRSSISTLDAAILLLQEYPSVRVEISGHTDSRGDHEHNIELSLARADSVKSYMVGMGLEDSRIETKGFGPDLPLDSNATKAGRATNRRIEFRILGAEESVHVSSP